MKKREKKKTKREIEKRYKGSQEKGIREKERNTRRIKKKEKRDSNSKERVICWILKGKEKRLARKREKWVQNNIEVKVNEKS